MLRQYIKGTRFTIRTDDDLLKRVFSVPDATSRLARKWLRLSEFDFGVVHSGDIKHQIAGALFRVTTTGKNQPSIGDDQKVGVLQSQTGRYCTIKLIFDTSTASDEADLRAEK